MKILIAVDKFKGSLDATKVCKAIAAGIHKYDPDYELILFPMADGGEGTARILTKHAGGRWMSRMVKGPLFQEVRAGFGLSGDGTTAFIEMAMASGIHLISQHERNPLFTTTYGTGQLILEAIQRKKVKEIVLGIGGSATNDGGIGMAQALGYVFKDSEGKALPPIGKSLSRVASIDDSQKHPRIGELSIKVACDVFNPLYGPNGAAYTYAAQKGADKSVIKVLDDGLRDYAKVLESTTGTDFNQIQGSGAAGGLGAGAIAFLNAELSLGVDVMMEYTNFKEQLEGVDLVITGEGKIDDQTLNGKVVKGICDVCNTMRKPVWGICGALEMDYETQQSIGLHGVKSILDSGVSQMDAMEHPEKYLKKLAFSMVKEIMEDKLETGVS